MLDRDLAGLYLVTTNAMNQAVKRHSERFPEKFIFRLSAVEWENVSHKLLRHCGLNDRKTLCIRIYRTRRNDAFRSSTKCDGYKNEYFDNESSRRYAQLYHLDPNHCYCRTCRNTC